MRVSRDCCVHYNTPQDRFKYSKKEHSLLLREIALELSLEVRTTGQNSNWTQRVSDMAPDTPVTFENMLKSLAYRTEDIYKRLTPLELKAREDMEVDVQSRVSHKPYCCYAVCLGSEHRWHLTVLRAGWRSMLNQSCSIFKISYNGLLIW